MVKSRHLQRDIPHCILSLSSSRPADTYTKLINDYFYFFKFSAMMLAFTDWRLPIRGSVPAEIRRRPLQLP